MRIIDVGCGPGIYVKALREAGFIADGCDLDPACPYDNFDIFSESFERACWGQYDLALCLEVAEHLPKDRADDLVLTLTKCAPAVMFSAAIPGQGGHGHINCQPKDYWVEKFARLNYVVDTEKTDELLRFMASGYHLGWFTQNAVIFRRYGDVYYRQIIEEETPQAVRLAEWLKQTTF